MAAAAVLSFPCDHATLSAAFYLALLIVFLARRPSGAAAISSAVGTALLAVGIALARVYLGVHYPTDVLAGILIGRTWTLLVGFSLGILQREPLATGAGARQCRA